MSIRVDLPADAISLGYSVKYDDQPYRFVEVVNTTNRHGEPCSYHVLEAECATCGGGCSIAWTPGAVFKPNRRCTLHRTGRRVHKVRGKKRSARLKCELIVWGEARA